MKKSVVALSVFGSLLMCNSVFASETNTDCPDSDVVFENLGVPVEVVSKVLEVSKIDGLSGLCAYAFASPSGNQVIVANERYAILGKLVDTEKKIVVQDELVKKYQNVGAEGFEALKKNASLVFGDSKREVVYITDPECPYCKKLTETLSKIEDLKVYVVLTPLQSHERGVKISEQIVCNNEELKSFDDYIKYVDEHMKKTSDEEGCTIYNERKKDVSRLSRKYRLDGGVPKIVFSDGSYEVGAVPAEFVELKLKEIERFAKLQSNNSQTETTAEAADEEDYSDHDEIEHLQDVSKFAVEEGTVVEEDDLETAEEVQLDEKDMEDGEMTEANQQADSSLSVQEKTLFESKLQKLKEDVAKVKASVVDEKTDKSKLRSSLIDFTTKLKADLAELDASSVELVNNIEKIEKIVDESTDETLQNNLKNSLDELNTKMSTLSK